MNKKIIIGVVGLLLLCGIGFGAYIMFFSEPPQEVVDSTGKDKVVKTKTEEEEITENNKVLYVKMFKPFIFNINGETRSRTVQINVQLKVFGIPNETLLKENLPFVESTLLDSFKTANVEQLTTKEGREQMKVQALEDLRDGLKSITGEPLVELVLFTNFVMQ